MRKKVKIRLSFIHELKRRLTNEMIRRLFLYIEKKFMKAGYSQEEAGIRAIESMRDPHWPYLGKYIP